MEFITQFISEYGTTILYAILTAIAGALGMWIKKVYTEVVNTKTKERIVKVCVQAVEQLYKDLHGEEKYNKVVESVVQMLEVLLEKAEETYNECSLLSENIDSLKEELDESIWWAKGGITKDTRKA